VGGLGELSACIAACVLCCLHMLCAAPVSPLVMICTAGVFVSIGGCVWFGGVGSVCSMQRGFPAGRRPATDTPFRMAGAGLQAARCGVAVPAGRWIAMWVVASQHWRVGGAGAQ
jgi:hypothetical protein